MPGLIIIVVVVIFGGMLAFLGDRVGMKVGKKRLSMFGLRPKYTSMIITVLTGFFIAGLTLLTLTLISEYARTAIFELHSIQEKLVVTTQKAQDLTRQMTQKQREVAALNRKYDTIMQDLAQTEAQLGNTQKDLDANKEINKDLTKKNNHLSNNNQGLVIQNNNLTQISDYLKKKNGDLDVERERLNQQIQNLESKLLSVQDRTKVIEGKPMLFYVGEILVARVVETGLKGDKVQETVITPLLQTANEMAVKQGARIAGKTNYALRIKPSRIEEVSEQLARLKSKAVLRVVVESNSVIDEPVNVSLEVFPDELIFKSGERIVETELTAKYSESELRDRLLSLLITAYNKAIAKGIITDEQNLKDVVSIAEMVNAINSIKQKPEGAYKAVLIATRDIYRTGPFRVRIEVKDDWEGGGKKSHS